MTAEAEQEQWPSVSVVIPTYNRPQLLELAIDAVLSQRYGGDLECLVVHDHGGPQARPRDLPAGRRLRLLHNNRSPGVAGARNAGLLAACGEFVAFCDDDDRWLPDKSRLQVRAMQARDDAIGVACGSIIEHDARTTTRCPVAPELSHRQLLRSRTSEVHSSALMFRRTALVDRVGLVDEQLPGGYGEDYDWLLRATSVAPVLTMPEPLVRVLWHRGSYFSHDWETMIRAIRYLIRKHPEFAAEPHGLARLHGRVAFAHAALGRRRQARESAFRSLRLNPLELRGYVALLASLRLLPPNTAIRLAHAVGRGL